MWYIALLSLFACSKPAQVESIIYIGLGYNGKTVTRNFYSCHAATQVWEKLPVDFPDKIAYPMVYQINKKIYIGLGEDDMNEHGQKAKDNFYTYNTTTQTWDTLLVNFPDKRSGTITLTIAGKVYIGLGYDRKNAKNDFYTYNTVTQTWDKLPTNFPDKRGYAIVYQIAEKTYIGLGWDGQKAKDDFYTYNSITQTWHKLSTNFPDKIGGAIAFQINGKTYKWRVARNPYQ